MKIGVIVHSHTGNTLSVAKRLSEKLIAKGHSVQLEQVVAVNEDPSAAGNVQLKVIPDISPYDAIIFCAPVRAFSLSPVMKAYLAQLPSLKSKQISCFVTQQFPYPWMGGNNSIKQMKTLIAKKDASVYGTGVVNWSSKIREEKIQDVIERLTSI